MMELNSYFLSASMIVYSAAAGIALFVEELTLQGIVPVDVLDQLTKFYVGAVAIDALT